MSYVAIINLLLKIVNNITSYFQQKQLLDAGEALAINKSMNKVLDRAKQAKVIDDSGIEPDDSFLQPDKKRNSDSNK